MWSLGCILAEMFLGKPLFQGTSTINQIDLIMATIPPPTPEGNAVTSKVFSYTVQVLKGVWYCVCPCHALIFLYVLQTLAVTKCCFIQTFQVVGTMCAAPIECGTDLVIR